ncbi:MAG: protein-L-isoaspartate(D-aspartate) O-methyltransferase [Halanaerobiales bacterium]
MVFNNKGESYREKRKKMVDRQLKSRGVTDEKVLKAMDEVPRHLFVKEKYQDRAYSDTALTIDEGQTISQPYIVALMIEAMGLKKDDKVLEIGTGSGYAAAVLSKIVDKVYTIERHSTLAETAEGRFQKLNYDNIEVITGDGSRGLVEKAPFAGIVVAAGAPVVPESLKEQLDIGGTLVIPIGEKKGLQKLLTISRVSEEGFELEDLGGVRFVPLIGEDAWDLK